MLQNTFILQNKNKNWLILSASNWNDLQVSNHFISQELANQSNKVYYIESPGVVGLNLERVIKILINFFFNRIFRKQNKNLTVKINHYFDSNLEIIKKFPLPLLGLPIIDNLIFLIFKKKKSKIYSLIKKADFILVCSPIWIEFIRYFQDDKNNFYKTKIFYHLVDDVESYQHLNFYFGKFKHFLSKINGIISPNQKLLVKYSVFNQKTYLVQHGFKKILEESIYKNENVQREKFIVYAGTFADWCDYELIKMICLEFKSLKIYLIGRTARNISSGFIHNLNVTFNNLVIKESLDRKDLHEFLLKCSVAIVPYKDKNAHIHFSSPSKIMDYLGCGLPVVSSDIPYCNGHPFVEIARNKRDFIMKIKNSLQIENKKRIKMINYALNNQWVSKVNRLCDCLLEIR